MVSGQPAGHLCATGEGPCFIPPGLKYAHVAPQVTTVALSYGGAKGSRKLVPSAGYVVGVPPSAKRLSMGPGPFTTLELPGSRWPTYH